jgi:hypothetical protein
VLGSAYSTTTVSTMLAVLPGRTPRVLLRARQSGHPHNVTPTHVLHVRGCWVLHLRNPMCMHECMTYTIPVTEAWQRTFNDCCCVALLDMSRIMTTTPQAYHTLYHTMCEAPLQSLG